MTTTGTWSSALAAVVGSLLGIALRQWVVVPAQVENHSMEPTYGPGRLVFARKLKRGELIHRGEVVLVRSAELSRLIVKRVVGLPGEQIVIEPNGGVRVNGIKIAEPYLRLPQVNADRARLLARLIPVDDSEQSATFNVPAGHLFLLGDNRAVSSDSRKWRQPYLPVDSVVGKVIRCRKH